MLVARIVLVLLPQVWVLDAYWTLHVRASAVAAEGVRTMEPGLLTHAALLLAVGAATLAANFLVAALLLRGAAGGHARRRRGQTTAARDPPSRAGAEPVRQPVAARSPVPGTIDPPRRADRR